MKRRMQRLVRGVCAVLCLSICGLFPWMEVGAAAEDAENETSWNVATDWEIKCSKGSGFAASRKLSLQLPQGHEKKDFSLHIVLEINAAAAEQLNGEFVVEFDNEEKCDTSEITWKVKERLRAGRNVIVLPFASGTNGGGSAYKGPAFSTDEPIRFTRLYSNTKAKDAAVIKVTDMYISYADGGIFFGSDGSDTYLRLEKPLDAVPNTVEATICVSPPETEYIITSADSVDKLGTISYSNAVSYGTVDWDEGFGEAAGYTAVSVKKGNKFGFVVTGFTASVPTWCRSTADLALDFWLYLDDNARGFTTGQLELTSSGKCDVNEINWNPMNWKLSAGWNHITLPLDEATVLKAAEPLDVHSINYLRWHTTTVDADGDTTVGIAAVRLVVTAEEPQGEDATLSATIFDTGDAAAPVSLRITVAGYPEFRFGDKTVTAREDVRTGETVSLAAVRDTAAGKLFLYINGEKAAEADAAGTADTVPASLPTVGADAAGERRFVGTVSNLRLWSVARTQDEVTRDAGTYGVTGKEQGLLGAWSLNGNITHILESLPNAAPNGSAFLYAGTRRNQWFDYTVPVEFGEDYATLVWIPDPQNITLRSRGTEKWEDDTDWIAANIEAENIFHVICAGDSTWDDNTTTWQIVQNGFSKFWDKVSWSLLTGNHDYPWTVKYRDSRHFNTFFGLEQIQSTAASETFAGYYEEDGNTAGTDYVKYPSGVENSYYLFTVGKQKWLLLQLEYNPRPSVMAWAETILEEYADTPVIIATHALLGYGEAVYIGSTMEYINEEREAGDFTENTGAIYETLAREHSNVKMVLSGHATNPNGFAVMTRNEKRKDGSVVYQFMINAQDMDTSDAGEFTYYDDSQVGMLCLFRFSADGTRVAVNWYCPSDDKSYEPVVNGKEPAATLGGNAASRSNFVLDLTDPVDVTPLREALTTQVKNFEGMDAARVEAYKAVLTEVKAMKAQDIVHETEMNDLLARLAAAEKALTEVTETPAPTVTAEPTESEKPPKTSALPWWIAGAVLVAGTVAAAVGMAKEKKKAGTAEKEKRDNG